MKGSLSTLSFQRLAAPYASILLPAKGQTCKGGYRCRLGATYSATVLFLRMAQTDYMRLGI